MKCPTCGQLLPAHPSGGPVFDPPGRWLCGCDGPKHQTIEGAANCWRAHNPGFTLEEVVAHWRCPTLNHWLGL